MHKWLLPTLSEVLAQSTHNGAEETRSSIDSTAQTERDTQQPSKSRIALERVKAEREWSSAIATLEILLRSGVTSADQRDRDPSKPLGLILAGPVPILSDSALISDFPTWTFTTQLAHCGLRVTFQLPPAKEEDFPIQTYGNSLPLLPVDPLAAEQFCLVLTANFSLVMVLGEDNGGTPAFMFSFEPEVVHSACISLRSRILLTCPHHLPQLDAFSGQFPTIAPDYRTVTQFTRLLLKHLPPEIIDHTHSAENRPTSVLIDQNNFFKEKTQKTNDKGQTTKDNSVELLQAFAHEVRTPLSTIRTLTRLLLKRKNLAPDIIKRLEIIDHECTEQIERMELIFQAAELETSPTESSCVHLTPVSLAQVFEDSLPRWEKQANRRNLTLEVVLPQQMPQVVSDPTMLDRILSGLIENFTRSLPAGSHIQVQVMPAGNQLKLQLQPQTGGVTPECNQSKNCSSNYQPTRKLIGQLLMFQPETGSLSLNHSVTKNLFQALGGKLIVRQRPQQGEVLTIYLPLETNSSDLRLQRGNYDKKLV